MWFKSAQLTILGCIFFAVACFAQEEKPRIAVLDFQSIGCDSSLGLAASEILRTELGSRGKYRIIERAQLVRVMEEQSLQISGVVDEQAMVEIGKLLGAKMVVVGSLVRTGKTYTLNSRFIDVQTAEVKKSQNIRGNSEDEISNMCSSLAKVISDDDISSATVSLSDAALGAVWIVQESEFTGIWRRRGESNVFDAMWFLTKEGVSADLALVDPASETLEFKRTDNGKALGSYRGANTAGSREFQGSMDWVKQAVWRAQPFFDAPATKLEASNPGAIWIESENDFLGVWRRIGQSNNFKATYYPTKNAVQAELTMEIAEQGAVKIKRTDKKGVLGFYNGTFSASGKHVGGAADWAQNVVWSAEIYY